MRIGIYGGTFNPIHNGHVHILTEFYTRLSLDLVLVIPTHVPPHKIAHKLASAKDRMAMCRLALIDSKISFEISDIEIRRIEKSYTADTILELRKLYSGDDFFLLMGEDMFMTIQNWVRPQVIFRNAVICGSPRSEDGYKALLSHGQQLQNEFAGFRFIVENIPYMEVSSTEIRNNADDEKKLLSLVPAAVAAYIKNGNVYG